MASYFDLIRNTLLDQAQKDNNIYFVYIDGYRCFFEGNSFIEKFPNRAIAAGISESNAVGIASGLALRGKNVYVIGIAAYVTGRAYDQVRVDMAYNNANVKIIGSLRGLKSGNAGYSHWAIEDFSLMKNLPNISIFSPGTEQDTLEICQYTLSHSGAMYIGTDMWAETISLKQNFKIDKMSKILNGHDFAIITHGNMLNKMFELSKQYHKKGIHPALYDCHSIKPFDKQTVENLIKKSIPIVTVEESIENGSIAQEVSMLIAQSNKKVKFLPIYINDSKFNFTGCQDYLIEQTMNLSSLKKQIDKKILSKFSKAKKIISVLTTYHESNEVEKEKYILLGLIPLLKIKKKKGSQKYNKYLFGFLKIS